MTLAGFTAMCTTFGVLPNLCVPEQLGSLFVQVNESEACDGNPTSFDMEESNEALVRLAVLCAGNGPEGGSRALGTPEGVASAVERLLAYIGDNQGATTFSPPLRFALGKGMRDAFSTPLRPAHGGLTGTGDHVESVGCSSVRERRIAAAEAADALRLSIIERHGIKGLYDRVQSVLDSPRSAAAGSVDGTSKGAGAGVEAGMGAASASSEVEAATAALASQLEAVQTQLGMVQTQVRPPVLSLWT
jgi:hypothetical protein